MNSLQESAWLAGLLEGEGFFTLTRHKKARPALRVGLKMTDRDVVEAAAALVPSKSTVRETTKPADANHKQAYRIEWCGVVAENLMRRILPYMGERRKERISELLAMDLSHHDKVVTAA